MGEIYDVATIGGGPAGITAGMYAARAGMKTLLIENPAVSSQAVLTAHIENYPGFPEGAGGYELISKMKKQAQSFGLEIAVTGVTAIDNISEKGGKCWKISTEDKTFCSLSVIIATGSSPRKLNVPGEEKFYGSGVSTCAICDGALYKNKKVISVGGGDTAVEESVFLAKFAESVTLVHRKNRLRAAKVIQDKAFANKKIKFVWDSVIEEIYGNNRVEGVKVKNIATGEKNNIPCDGVFIFVGYTPNTDLVKGKAQLDEAGYIITDVEMKTTSPGMFACGDCRKKTLRQVITACGDGAVAAHSARKYVEELKGTSYK